jgi:hypothetical protein
VLHQDRTTAPQHSGMLHHALVRRLPSCLPTASHHSLPSSPSQHGVVHGDCSSATFFIAPSRLPAAILPLHCTQVPLMVYRISTSGRPWLPATPCVLLFQVFQKLFSSVSSGYCICCNGYIHMLQVYVSSVLVILDVCFECFHLDVAEVYLDVA